VVKPLLPFEFSIPGRIVIGAGSAGRLGEIAAGFGRKALLLSGARALADSGALGRLVDSLAASRVESVVHQLPGEPRIDAVDRLAELAHTAGCDLVAGAGGGSVLDAAKAVSALLGNHGPVRRYMELVGEGQPLSRPAAPMIALPTTAGSGSEVTHNAVLTCPERKIKASMRSVLMLPRVVLVDPRLAVGLPPAVTASTGLDALTQLMESCASRRATTLTTSLALEGIDLVGRCLRRSCAAGDDLQARQGMSLAALLSGITLAHAGLGAAHGIAGPLGGRIPVPHGIACARLLPRTLETNLRALQNRDPQSPSIKRLAEAGARLLGRTAGGTTETVLAAAAWVRDFCTEMEIPGLRSFGMGEDDLLPLAAAAQQASSMKANPVTLTAAELVGIIKSAL
jgi:alcohol dehydrogenase class IV